MSQNRGYRRDGRTNYQMNTYGRSGSQINVNPWEGGMVPGGVRSSVAGLLPTPPQTGSLISQLSSPETQLALASNLLSTLLRPQQQQSQVPSLLSLGALGQVGGVGNYRQGGYDQGRFGDRVQNRHRIEQRRSDYGKGRHIASSKGGSERKSGGAGYRSPNVGKRPASGSKVGSKADKKDDAQKDKDEDKANDEEDTKREDGEENEGKKRDWKDEKKHDDEEEDDGDEKGTDKGKKSSRYHGIPDHLFFCHVCKKHMWDDQSFENHLKGRTHQLMMDKLDESYRIKVELMRHELKVAEQQREIEMDRIKRRGRKVHMNLREYCTMCDLHFYGKIVVHRKNKRHQQLKSFLHPKCGPCGKEFASHIEWDHHKLTPLHLRKTAESQKNRETDSDDEFGIEDLIALGNEDMFTKNEMKVRTKEEEKEDIGPAEKTDKDDDKDEEMKDEETKEDGKEESEKPEAKTEDGATVEDPTSAANSENVRIPKYNPDVPYATSLVKKIAGFHCRACRRFYVNEEDSQMHCRTMTHYNNTVTLLKIKLQKITAKQQREIRKDSEKLQKNAAKQGETRKEGEKSKRNSDEKVDDEGNWKRRKVSGEKDDDDEGTQVADGAKGDAEMTDASEKKKKSDSTDKYDPLEADAEAEAAENKDASDSPSKNKAEEDKMWSEVDRDIGSILEAVDDENEDVEMGDGEDQSRQEQEAKDEKTSPRATRGSASATSARGSPARGRGRKRK